MCALKLLFLGDFFYDFDYIAEILAKRDLHPTIICESDGNMAQDALKLKNMYLEKRQIK